MVESYHFLVGLPNGSFLLDQPARVDGEPGFARARQRRILARNGSAHPDPVRLSPPHDEPTRLEGSGPSGLSNKRPRKLGGQPELPYPPSRLAHYAIPLPPAIEGTMETSSPEATRVSRLSSKRISDPLTKTFRN